MTFRMQQQLQEFDFNVVHRAVAKHGKADGLSRMLEEGPDWMPGEKEKAFGSCPEPISLDRKQVKTEWRLSQWSVMKPKTEGKWGLKKKRSPFSTI